MIYTAYLNITNINRNRISEALLYVITTFIRISDVLRPYEMNTDSDHFHVVTRLLGAVTDQMSFIKLLLSTSIFTQQE
jgi:hypothetical protein